MILASGDLGEAFSPAAALAYGVALVTFVSGLIGLGRMLNKRIENAAATAVEVAERARLAAAGARDRVTTSNGHSAGWLIERTAQTVERLDATAQENRSQISETRSLVVATRELATQAIRRAEQADDRAVRLLTEHMATGHRPAGEG